VDERSQVLATTVLGAMVGGVLGFLYLTERGREIRTQIEPFFDAVSDELQQARRTVDKARDAASEGRRAFDDVLRPTA
jgi:uncharacterized protein YcfJ